MTGVPGQLPTPVLPITPKPVNPTPTPGGGGMSPQVALLIGSILAQVGLMITDMILERNVSEYINADGSAATKEDFDAEDGGGGVRENPLHRSKKNIFLFHLTGGILGKPSTSNAINVANAAFSALTLGALAMSAGTLIPGVPLAGHMVIGSATAGLFAAAALVNSRRDEPAAEADAPEDGEALVEGISAQAGAYLARAEAGGAEAEDLAPYGRVVQQYEKGLVDQMSAALARPLANGAGDGGESV
jgi:hypothetical protein